MGYLLCYLYVHETQPTVIPFNLVQGLLKMILWRQRILGKSWKERRYVFLVKRHQKNWFLGVCDQWLTIRKCPLSPTWVILVCSIMTPDRYVFKTNKIFRHLLHKGAVRKYLLWKQTYPPTLRAKPWRKKIQRDIVRRWSYQRRYVRSMKFDKQGGNLE
jgi:hypothetical protein